MNKHYFPHDYFARKDPKICALINDFGYEGYGIYLSIVEILHENDGKIKKFPELISGLAYDLRIDKEALLKQIEAMLHDYELLLEDDKFIWSGRVLRNLEEQKEKYLLKAKAGRIGGIKSGKIREKLSHSEKKQNTTLKQNEALLKQNELKESKIKENKINTIAEPSSAENKAIEIIPNLLQDNKRHIRIIGLFAIAKGISFKSREHQSQFIKRNLRAATALLPYEDSRIAEVMSWLNKNADFKWTIESIGKYADEDLSKLSGGSNIVIGT